MQNQKSSAPLNADPVKNAIGPIGPIGTNGLFVIWLLLLWGGVTLISVFTRPLLPVDETRYLSVAWDMWVRGDWLVPHLNGEAYSHKPPLFFWLMHLGWAVFGVNDITPKLVAPVFSLISLFFTFSLAKRLWPSMDALPMRAAFLLFGSMYWVLFSTMVMFDMLVGTFALAGLWALLKVIDSENTLQRLLAWVLFGLALGLGALAKGPAVLVYTMPVALLAPWWDVSGRVRATTGWGKWYAGVFAGLIIGIGIGMAWAWPAGQAGGEEYRNAIFFGQTAGRVVDSFAHQRPVWWYVLIIGPLLLPMAIWLPGLKGLWRGFFTNIFSKNKKSKGLLGEGATRFCFVWFVAGFVIFSFISGKQPHYMLPLLPAAALLVARAMELVAMPTAGWRIKAPVMLIALLAVGAMAAPFFASHRMDPWMFDLPLAWMVAPLLLAGFLFFQKLPSPKAEASIASLVAIFVMALHLAVSPGVMKSFDFSPIARHLAKLDSAGHPIAHYGKYRGEYHFLGRFNTPLQAVYNTTVYDWAKNNPDGFIVYHSKADDPAVDARPEFIQTYRTKWVLVRSSRQISAMPQLIMGEN
ncbi:MAG: glycosyltransferase family 39 protein [Rhodospirillaceae bacterium]|nr:glycosyltransferase family 39 protein [Rhodospirillaceae bacterium]